MDFDFQSSLSLSSDDSNSIATPESSVESESESDVDDGDLENAIVDNDDIVAMLENEDFGENSTTNSVNSREEDDGKSDEESRGSESSENINEQFSTDVVNSKTMLPTSINKDGSVQSTVTEQLTLDDIINMGKSFIEKVKMPTKIHNELLMTRKIYPNGDVYEGILDDKNKRTGFGKMMWANGDVYQGWRLYVGNRTNVMVKW